MKRYFLLSLLAIALSSFPIFAKNNATFYLKDGSKKDAEFVGMEDNVVTVRITMPDSSIVIKKLSKDTFVKIETYDWVTIDLTQSDYPPKKTAPQVNVSAKDTADTISTSRKEPQVTVDTNLTKETTQNSADVDKIATLIESGKYERKSISYVNALLCLDESAKKISGEDKKYILDKIKSKISMARFDYNPLPQNLVDSFVNMTNSTSDLNSEKLAKIMDKTIVRRIIKILDFFKESRAQTYTSETERNSFFVQKAKGFGFTMSELSRVMNAAFIYIPFVSDYKTISKDDKLITSMNLGIIWYRITTKNDKAHATLVVNDKTLSMGFAKEGHSYLYDGKTYTAQDFAFCSCVKNAARNLLVSTQSMPEFRLSGQVIEHDGGDVGFELGKKEGLTIDDKFNVAEFEEQEDGTVKQVNSGWVTVTSVADSNSKEGYKSKAIVCAGDPSVGAVISEYPRIPIDIAFYGKVFPSISKDDCKDKQLSSMGFGGQIDARYNVGRMIGMSQLFLGIGAGMGVSSVTDSLYSAYNGTTVSHFNIDGIIMKRFILGRCLFGLEGGVTRQTASVNLNIGSVALKEDFAGTGFFGGINFGIAFSPCLQLDLAARYETTQLQGVFNPADNSISENYGADQYAANMSGVEIHLGLTWSPPALPFDPLDMFRGMSGM